MSERTDKERSGGRTAPPGGGGVAGGAGGGAGQGGAGPRSVPRDAHAIMGMLKELGVTDFEPRCVTQLLEFAHRYVTAVLEDARAFANHAKKKGVEAEDVRLAAASYADRSFTAPPPRELLLELTRGKNLAPLPLVKPHCGLRLPPDRFCLSACNYRLARARKPRALPAPGGAAAASVAAGGHSALKRPAALLTVPKTQAVSVPKPVFKFSSASKTAGKQQQQVTVKTEVDVDVSGAVKRKREDDYDVL